MKTWDDIAVTALVGTERQATLPPSPAGPLGETLARLAGQTTEDQLLGVSAFVALWQKAGRVLPRRTGERLTEAGIETQAECTARAGELLLKSLGDEEALTQDASSHLVIEWLDLASGIGRLVPPCCLVRLFQKAERDSQVRARLSVDSERLLGRRGVWLARQNPDWTFATGVQLEEASAWEEGLTPQRVAFFNRLREKSPQEALSLLTTGWPQESADDRKTFLESLEPGLSMNDEPFLEAALDDRSKGVRTAAAKMLSRIPPSRFTMRMVERVTPLVRISKSFLGKIKIEVDLPEGITDPMKRDGIEELKKPPEKIGIKGSALNQLIALTPLEHWQSASAMDPAALIAAARKTDWGFVLVNGWAQAASIQTDRQWLLALIANPNDQKPEYNTRDILGLLSGADLRAWLTEIPNHVSNEADLAVVLETAQGLESSLDAELTKAVLSLFTIRLFESHSFDHTRMMLLDRLALLGDPHFEVEMRSLVQLLVEKQQGWPKRLQQSLDLYELRCAMHKEIKQ